MRYAKVFRIFTVAMILSLLLLALPAAPALALAAREITLTPDQGAVGDSITVEGTGFTASDDTHERHVDIYFSSDEAVLNNLIDTQVDRYKLMTSPFVDENGEFSTTFNVPSVLNDGDTTDDVRTGTYYIYVTAEYYAGVTASTLIRALATFTVTGGEISISPTTGKVGSDIEITGTEFAANEDITVKFDGTAVTIDDGDRDTDSSGDFFSVIVVPESAAGVRTITVTVAGNEVTADFNVESQITLSVASGQPGAGVQVTGTGFGRRSNVVVYFNGDELETKTALSNGSFTITFTVPELPAGEYTLEADDGVNLGSAKFTVSGSAQPTPTPTPTTTPTPTPTPTLPPSSTSGSLSPAATGAAGSDLIVSGVGFTAGKTATVTFDDAKVATSIVTAQGIVIAAFKVPVGKHGQHTVNISDGTNSLKLTFTVESEKPPIPPPLVPAMSATLKPPITFDWEDVTDKSAPVTYDLQVANDAIFASLVLDKTGITESGYTLTETEEQKLVAGTLPFYWRIRAVDAASNEGDWTGAGQFSVAAPISIPDWALYTIIGLGGLLLFALGYLLGRRSAFGGY